MIIFAVSLSSISPGGLFNHQIALADTGTSGNTSANITNASFTPEIAPLNPAYIAYVNSRSGLMAMSLSTADPNLGLIPAPLDLSGLTGEQIDMSGSLPVYSDNGSYDLRTLNRVTSVKDQGTSGSCWAFATYGSMESYLLNKTGETWDFSENNLKNNAGFDIDPNAGGNYEMAMAYLTRWSGPVDESDDPFDASSTTSPTNLNAQKQVQNAYIIPDRNNSTDNGNIKSALMNYGAIFTSMYMSLVGNYYNISHAAYYDNTVKNGNHAITIVGWDDNYSRYNFSITPPGDGAFIVKNSWGSSWGDSGYFYVSYYDRNFGIDNAVFTADPISNYDHVYQYDPLGWVGNMGIGSNTTWFANDFTAGSRENITAVGFYTDSLNSQYTVDIIMNGLIVETMSGTLPMAGYNTVVLNSAVQVSGGSKFRVAVELPTHGDSYPIPIEYPKPGYSSRAQANAQESYVGNSLDSMVDITTINQGVDLSEANVCLKAYTIDVDHGSGTVQFNQSSYNVSEGDAYATINVTLSSPPEEPIRVVYATTNGTALSGINYKKTSGVLQFNSGMTVASFNVPIIDNYVINGNSSFNISLSNPRGGTSLGSTTNATVNIIEDDKAASFTLNMTTGWNLISIPVVLQNNNITSFFPDDVKSNITIVWAYDNSNPQAPFWQYYKPSRQINTLSNISEKRGYWVLMKNDASILISGVLPGNDTITINKGWNLIGDPSLVNQSNSSVFGNYYLTWNYVNNQWYYYKPTRTSNTMSTVLPCYGYWVLNN